MPKGIDMPVWLAFLAFCGLEYKRTEASHDVYDLPDGSLPRPVIVRPGKDVQVPLLHMHTTLKTLGKQMKDFTAWHHQATGKGGKLKKLSAPPETGAATPTSPPASGDQNKKNRK